VNDDDVHDSKVNEASCSLRKRFCVLKILIVGFAIFFVLEKRQRLRIEMKKERKKQDERRQKCGIKSSTGMEEI
jgi:large-conductance mechanosensitive channel